MAKTAAWQRKEGKNPKGGLNAKGRASYNRETGGNLKAPQGSGTDSRPMIDAKGKPTRKALALKKWGFSSEAAARNFCNRHKKS
jgi:hypothetical protein